MSNRFNATAPDTERCTRCEEAELLGLTPIPHDCTEQEEPELSTAEELGAGSYLGYGNNLP